MYKARCRSVSLRGSCVSAGEILIGFSMFWWFRVSGVGSVDVVSLHEVC